MHAASGDAQEAKKQLDGGDPGSSSGRSNLCHGHVHSARVGHNRVNGIPSRQRPTAVRRAQDRQLRDAQPARLGRPSSRPTGTALKAIGAPSEMTGSDNGTHCDSML